MTEEASFAQFKLRMPSDLKSLLDEASELAGRSLSAEIIHRLYESFSDIEVVLFRNRITELRLIRSQIHECVMQLDEIHRSSPRQNSEQNERRAESVRIRLQHLRGLETSLSYQLADLESAMMKNADSDASSSHKGAGKKKAAKHR